MSVCVVGQGGREGWGEDGAQANKLQRRKHTVQQRHSQQLTPTTPPTQVPTIYTDAPAAAACLAARRTAPSGAAAPKLVHTPQEHAGNRVTHHAPLHPTQNPTHAFSCDLNPIPASCLLHQARCSTHLQQLHARPLVVQPLVHIVQPSQALLGTGVLHT